MWPAMKPRTAIRRPHARLAGPLLCAGLLLASCGDPEFQYPHDAAEGVYFKVPADWDVSDETEAFYDGRVDGASTAQPVRVWVVDADPDPDPAHLDDPARDLPVGIAQIIAVSPSLAEAVSIASVRASGFDFDPVSPPADFEDLWEVTIDQPLRTADGISGSVAIFNHRDSVDDPWLTQSRITFVDPTRQRVYIFDMYCNATCFEQYYDDIFDVIDSWRIDL
jgi:hypothetical protein